MKEKTAAGFTKQDNKGKWIGTLIHMHGSIESWGHETRIEAERMVTYWGSKLGLRKTGEWRRE